MNINANTNFFDAKITDYLVNLLGSKTAADFTNNHTGTYLYLNDEIMVHTLCYEQVSMQTVHTFKSGENIPDEVIMNCFENPFYEANNNEKYIYFSNINKDKHYSIWVFAPCAENPMAKEFCYCITVTKQD